MADHPPGWVVPVDVVAERQRQTATRNILGRQEIFDAVPFFRVEPYDFGVSYIGHTERWGEAEMDGHLDARGRTIIHRDLEGLRAEVEFERAVAAIEERARFRG